VPPFPPSDDTGVPCRSEASPSFVCEAHVMATGLRVAPIFSVRDLDAAIRFYRRLGFTVRAYSGGGYGLGLLTKVGL